jgi:hypothetical protein
MVCGTGTMLSIKGELPINGVWLQVKATGKQRCPRSASTMIAARGVEPSNRADPLAIRSLCGDIPLLPGCDIVEVWGP